MIARKGRPNDYYDEIIEIVTIIREVSGISLDLMVNCCIWLSGYRNLSQYAGSVFRALTAAETFPFSDIWLFGCHGGCQTKGRVAERTAQRAGACLDHEHLSLSSTPTGVISSQPLSLSVPKADFDRFPPARRARRTSDGSRWRPLRHKKICFDGHSGEPTRREDGQFLSNRRGG